MCEFCGCAGQRNAKETKHEVHTSGSSVTFRVLSRSMVASAETAEPRAPAERERADAGTRPARQAGGRNPA